MCTLLLRAHYLFTECEVMNYQILLIQRHNNKSSHKKIDRVCAKLKFIKIIELRPKASIVSSMFKATPNCFHYNIHKSKEVTIRDFYLFRMKVQKAEILAIWLFILFNIFEHLLSSTQKPNERQNDIESLSISLTIAALYIKLSLLTRFLAYAVDFVNARKKLGLIKNKSFAGFPMWLILHHGGVFVIHCIVAKFISPRDHIDAVAILAVIQSTHNTWTKKYSKFLYWGNVLFGVLAVYINAIINIRNAFWAWTSVIAMMLVVDIGIGLLFVESMGISLRVTGRNVVRQVS